MRSALKQWSRVVVLASAFSSAASAATAADDVSAALKWRLIGPFRAGWSTMAEGVPDRPGEFYFSAAGGGVWKTEDAGATWQSLGDTLGAAAVEAIALAPSDPNVIWAGTGLVEARYDVASGNGVYKSTDGGRTWSTAGLSATRNIGKILVDPRRSDTVLVGALGHYFGPNPERGVFRSEDGGKSWQQTLAIDADTGVVDLARDPQNPDAVYAAAWQVRNYPWLSYFQPNGGPGSAVYKSTDGGRTWKRLSGGGWPEGQLGRIGLAAGSAGRVYAVINAAPHSGNVPHAKSKDEGGLYRSDDGGATWKRASGESWLENDYFSRITVDPANRDRVYSAGQSIRRSDDGGEHWTIFKGAPGGDDYHYLWINPKHADHMVTASDQGTAVTVDGGKTWSDWYNQPTGQFYHLAADNRFPYWIYSGQQDSGTVGAASRSDYGALSFRDWHPVGGDERDYDVPDPQDANIVYGSGLGGRLSRWDARTGEVQNISPWPLSTYGARPTDVKYRYTWITPIAVSQMSPFPLYQGAQVLFRSLDKGQTWETISPDLSAKSPDAKNCAGDLAAAAARACGYGVIYSIGLSPRDNDEIWIGTDDGLIRLTRDSGKHWENVTPSSVPAWAKVATVDVSALAPGTAYAAIDNHRQDDFRPHALRTRDYGKTWTDISIGLPADHFVAVVRADPLKSGLLYAGTDAGAYVSFDDGAHWQTLQRNLPTAWVRDLLVHGDDLIAATQGRAIWVLDDVTPLRQHERLAQKAPVLFTPATTVRVRGSQGKDTPPPADTALGENPPTGAIFDYWLPANAQRVALEIHDASGAVVRRFASDKPESPPDAERYFTQSWTHPPQALSAGAGAHRFVWNLRQPRPRSVSFDYSIGAVLREGTPIVPEGMLVAPGEYEAVLDVDGKRQQAKLNVIADPRVALDSAAVREAAALAREVAAALETDYVGYGQLHAVDAQLAKIDGEQASPPLRTAIEAYRQASEPLRAAKGADSENLEAIGGLLASLVTDLEGSDRMPTQPQRELLASAQQRLKRATDHWQRVQGAELAQLNEQLRSAGLPALAVPAPADVRLDDAPESKDLP
jgi:photosystem II stability/assembly factor-like uncharacterized protein